jgi:DNA polymerase III epsilon subunit family exonuclease
MALAILAVVVAFVVVVLFIVKSRHRRTSDRDPEEHASTSPPIASVKRVPVFEATEPDTEIAYAPLESFSFQMSGRAQEADGSAFLPDEFVVFDLETTGLTAATDEIIEFGAIRVARNAESHLTFQSLVKPSCKVSARITQITGITQGILNAQGRPIAEVLPVFLEFVGDCPLVAFNAPFDMGFLRQAAKKCGLTFANPSTCALQRSRTAWPELPSHKLVDLARMHNLQTIDSHRALGDCGRTVHIFIQAVELLGQKIRWTTVPVDSSTQARYNTLRNANRVFVSDTRPLESSNPEIAAIRYGEALASMYGYEKLLWSRSGDELILDRLTIILGKLGRHRELIDHVDDFMRRFPDSGGSSVATILKRRAKAESKLQRDCPAGSAAKPSRRTNNQAETIR